jgi:hypothetical protein
MIGGRIGKDAAFLHLLHLRLFESFSCLLNLRTDDTIAYVIVDQSHRLHKSPYMDIHRKFAKNQSFWHPLIKISYQGVIRCPSQGKPWCFWKRPPITTASRAVFAAPFSAAWTLIPAKAMSIDASGLSIA